MSKRLQVLFDEAEYERVQGLARDRGLTVAEWVRQAVRKAAREEPAASVERKPAALKKALQYDFPTAEIDQMNAEIEAGYPSGEWPRS
jgi:hypothetical protein